MNELSSIIEESDFKVISTVIDKNLLTSKYKETENPYHIALKFCLERLYKFLMKHNQIDKQTNSIGMQLSDMIARPIGKYIINPNQENRAFEIIKSKFDCNKRGSYNKVGLKKFP